MATKEEKLGALEVAPIKMTRKVSFRDEKEVQKGLEDVHLVPSYKNLNAEERNSSCLKCELF